VIRHWSKAELNVLERIGEPLNRAIEVRRRCVDKEEMVETFRNESPASNQRIAQDKGGIVPDESIAQRWRVSRRYRCEDEERRDGSFHKKQLDSINRMRV
jgi:hypothetical protein